MSWVRVFLWFNAVSFVGYGVACLLSPALPAGYAGFDLGTTSGTVEIVAMYGGLQIGFGLLLIVGARRPEMEEPVLWAMVCVVGSLGLARLFGIVFHGASPYNLAAMGYELIASGVAFAMLRARGAQEATP